MSKKSSKKKAPKKAAKKRASKKASPRKSKRGMRRGSRRAKGTQHWLFPHSSVERTASSGRRPTYKVRQAGHRLGEYSATSRGLALHIHHH